MRETTLFFVRHGETDYNRQHRVQGRGIDAELNATGHAQAEALARRLAGEPFDAIYASTMRRAIQTAERVAQHRPPLPFYRLAGLDEMAWGILEGEADSSYVQHTFATMQAHWGRGEYDRRVEGGESILEVQHRALQALDHVMTHHAGGTVLVVAHGRLLRVLLASILDEYGLGRMQDVRHANTCVNELVHRGGRYEARRLNCTSHLSHDAPEPVLLVRRQLGDAA